MSPSSVRSTAEGEEEYIDALYRYELMSCVFWVGTKAKKKHFDFSNKHKEEPWPVPTYCAFAIDWQGNLAEVLHRHRLLHPDEHMICVNVAGQKYMFRPSTVLLRCPFSLLYRFVLESEEGRRKMADGHTDDEFYFERSAQAFDPIYRYYVTGTLHKPRDVCIDEFLVELRYWEIPVQALAPCCMSEVSYFLQRLAEPAKSPSDMMPMSSKSEVELEYAGLCCSRVRMAAWNLIEVPESSLVAKIFAFLSIGFVILSNAGLIFGTLQDCQVPLDPVDPTANVTIGPQPKVIMVPHQYFVYLETVCVLWFSMEYFGKMSATPRRWAVAKESLNIIDLLAILPFYLEGGLHMAGVDIERLHDLKGAFLVIRILRVLRVVRIFKLGRYSSGLQTFAKTLMQSVKQLGMMAMVLMTGVIFFSTLVYYLEREVEGTLFTSIPATFWWCIVTMTTVGYGDVVPLTVPGKLVASCAIACGVLVLALPITVIVDNFMKVADDEDEGPTEPGQGLTRFRRPQPTPF